MRVVILLFVHFLFHPNISVLLELGDQYLGYLVSIFLMCRHKAFMAL